MLAAMEGLKTVCGQQPLKKLVRGGGASRRRRSWPLKQGMIRAAMGLDGELPTLAKGEKSNITRGFNKN